MNTQTELNQLRTAILTSNGFRKWRNHIRKQLKTITENEIARHDNIRMGQQITR